MNISKTEFSFPLMMLGIITAPFLLAFTGMVAIKLGMTKEFTVTSFDVVLACLLLGMVFERIGISVRTHKESK